VLPAVIASALIASTTDPTATPYFALKESPSQSVPRSQVS
jgi:hypothetical protein